MVGALFDTCILIDYLRGIDAARIEIEACGQPAISIVSRIEVLAGAPDGAEAATRAFLSRFELLPLDEPTADRAALIRREQRLKLPDAVILATALSRGLTLVTRDEKAFGGPGAYVRVPYRLGA